MPSKKITKSARAMADYAPVAPDDVVPSAATIETIATADTTEALDENDARVTEQAHADFASLPQPNAPALDPDCGAHLPRDPMGDRLVGIATRAAMRAEIPSAYRADPSVSAAIAAALPSLLARK